jgi:CheY-like chemotaxis protein
MFNQPPAKSVPPCLRRDPVQPDHRPARVLIVDETQEVARTLARLFRSWGHEVAVACRWDDGLRQASSGAPDVVVVNRGSRKASSLKSVRLMRLLPGLHKSALIVVREGLTFLLGGPADSGDLEAGATDLQPLERDLLRQTIGSAGQARAAGPAPAI